MQVVVHSDSQRALTCFRHIQRSDEFEVELRPLRDYRKHLRTSGRPLVVYLDVQGLSHADLTRALKYFSSENGVLLGLIDSKESVQDVAGLFHRGAFDYIGKSVWRDGITLRRFRRAVDAFSERLQTNGHATGDDNEVVPLDRWANVVPGKEYTFCFMFFELDLNEDWKTKSGREHLDRVTSSLESHIQRTVSASGGRIWMWSEYGGLVLFPFNGRSCDAVLTAYRMMLNRTVISAESFEFNTLLSYRIAIHVGNTIYRPRGETGTIIADSVNFIFHLGHQFAQPGELYLTSTAYPHVPKGLESSFVDTGIFEGYRIYRMRQPIK